MRQFFLTELEIRTSHILFKHLTDRSWRLQTDRQTGRVKRGKKLMCAVFEKKPLKDRKWGNRRMHGATEVHRRTQIFQANGNYHLKKAILQRFRYFVNESLCVCIIQ